MYLLIDFGEFRKKDTFLANTIQQVSVCKSNGLNNFGFFCVGFRSSHNNINLQFYFPSGGLFLIWQYSCIISVASGVVPASLLVMMNNFEREGGS